MPLGILTDNYTSLGSCSLHIYTAHLSFCVNHLSINFQKKDNFFLYTQTKCCKLNTYNYSYLMIYVVYSFWHLQAGISINSCHIHTTMTTFALSFRSRGVKYRNSGIQRKEFFPSCWTYKLIYSCKRMFTLILTKIVTKSQGLRMWTFFQILLYGSWLFHKFIRHFFLVYSALYILNIHYSFCPKTMLNSIKIGIEKDPRQRP